MRNIFEKKPPSDWIEEAVCNSGSPVQECEHCGRTHYNSSGEHMEEGELEQFEAKAKISPDEFHGHDGDVRWGLVMGKYTVIDCPCNFLTRWEKIIWNDRQQIARYLRNRSATQMEKAKQDLEISESIADLK